MTRTTTMTWLAALVLVACAQTATAGGWGCQSSRGDGQGQAVRQAGDRQLHRVRLVTLLCAPP